MIGDRMGQHSQSMKNHLKRIQQFVMMYRHMSGFGAGKLGVQLAFYVGVRYQLIKRQSQSRFKSNLFTDVGNKEVARQKDAAHKISWGVIYN